jgi:hypothetical protein
MTQAQKLAKDKFKKAIAYRSKTGVSLKEAFAHIYGKKKSAPKKKAAPKKVAAIKIIEKGESKSAKAKATYQQVRTKKGTFKGLKKVGYDQQVTASNFTRISSDTNGNPRYVIHYLNVDRDYDKALKIARKIGGKKFHNKQYGGGIVFQSYNISETAKYLNNAISENKIGAVPKKKSAASKRITDIHKDSKSHNVNIRVVSGLPSYKDPDMARELELYADNDSLLYFQRRKPILINLSKKYKKGTYDIQKAAKLWRYYIDAALEKYNKEFGSRGDKWYDLMSVPDRNLLALEYAQNTKEEFDLGNFTEK